MEHKCGYCETIFHRPPSRRAKFCTPECSKLSKRRTLVNDFSNKDAESCYWAGFLFGDGSVDASHKLQVCLSDMDIEHLRKLSNYLFGVDYVNIYAGRVHLQVTNKDLCFNLSRYGVTPNKTYGSVIKPPENYTSDFLRGFFDADGWLFIGEYYNKNYNKFYDKRCLGVCSYLRENVEIFNKYMPVEGYISSKKSQTLYELRWQSRADISSIMSYLDGSVKLERKWNKNY